MTPPPPVPAGRPADRSVTIAVNPSAEATNGLDAARSLRDLVMPALATGETSRCMVEVVDIGANPIDGDPPYQLLLDAGLCRVTGFEPQLDALADLHRRSGGHERYLPYAVGDGGRHTLHLCASSGFASLLEPDEQQLELLIDFPALARVTGQERVDTRRLDDIEEITDLDLLKIDIQGGELSVLSAGRAKLSRAVAVQTEVGFHRLYRNQPTFAEVDLELRDQGFIPHQFVATRTWPMNPIVWADPLERAARQLVEADILYVRDPVQLGALDEGQLGRLILVADVVYGSFGLALRCVRELIDRGVLDQKAEELYRAMAAARLPG